jgi:molecular chaperone DnaK
LQKTLYDLSSKLYQQAGAAQGNPDMGDMGNMDGAADNGGDDDVIDADYKEV